MEYPIFLTIIGFLSILFGIGLVLWPKTGAIAMAWITGIVFLLWGGSYLVHAYWFNKYL
jgi:uncharacterized membrane protein HdeD (DUF308 family)